MKIAVIFTAIEGIGTPHLAAFKAHNPDVPYFVATKPANLHFSHHMDNTIVECWAENREGLDVDYVIHADYDTRIACDIMRALAVSEDRLVDVLVNAWTLSGRGITLNLVAFKKSMLDLMVDEYAAFSPEMYCETRVFAFCQAHGLHGREMNSDVCREMEHGECKVEWWEQRFAHPIKHTIDNLADETEAAAYAQNLKSYATAFDRVVTPAELRYHNLCTQPSDINEHLPVLRVLATQCRVVTELGVRNAVSTAAFVVARPKLLRCCDIERSPAVDIVAKHASDADVRFSFELGDSRQIEAVACDLLFIDTMHTRAQLTAELERHGPLVARWIVLHDTVTFGERGEDGGEGLLPAVREFIAKYPWRIAKEYTNNNGLMILEPTVLTCQPD